MSIRLRPPSAHSTPKSIVFGVALRRGSYKQPIRGTEIADRKETGRRGKLAKGDQIEVRFAQAPTAPSACKGSCSGRAPATLAISLAVLHLVQLCSSH